LATDHPSFIKDISIDPASVYTTAAIDADIRALSCPTVAFAAVEDDAHITPGLKLSAQCNEQSMAALDTAVRRSCVY